jgi:hypothetical protein
MNKRLLAALFIPLFAACKDSTGGDPVGQFRVVPEVTGAAVGDTAQLSAVILSTSGDTVERRVSWRSLNTSVATVDGNGVVRGVAPGTAQVEGQAGGRADTATVIVVTGTVRRFNVNSAQGCSSPLIKPAKLVASTARVAIFEDLTNPAGGPTADQYQTVANSVEGTVYDVDVNNFGAPTDIDGNGRIVILYTRAVNELTPANAGFIVGGFQYSRDLFPRSPTNDLEGCPASNVAEMFYMLSADPTGSVNGNPRSVTFVLGSTVGIVAHEFQHVINASRRLYVVRAGATWEESVWLNEGLSHIAEELNFYAFAGRTPDQNLSLGDVRPGASFTPAFQAHGIANIDRFDAYLETVPNFGPFEDDDDLETRGATWAYLRYVADRRNGNDAQFWASLVNTALVGLPNVDAATGSDAMALARDWAIALYTDDAVPGVASIYTNPSWNFRSIMTQSRWGGYALPVTALTSGVTANPVIRAGSAAYYRFGVPPAGTGDVRVGAAGTTVTGGCTVVTLAAGGVFSGTPANASAVCLTGGPTGAEYALVVHNGARDNTGTSANRNLAVSVTGTGILAPTAPPSPVRFPTTEATPRALGYAASGVNDGGFERRLREREHRELGRLVRNRGAGPLLQQDPAPSGITINVVRIR